MITNWLGKIFFARLQPWQREREARTILAAVLVALILAGVIAWVICWRNYTGK